jgi:hypothetical protein
MKIPTILLDSSSTSSFNLFNSNQWNNQSRGVIQSCATEHSLINFCFERLNSICKNADKYCYHQLETLQQQWKKSHWDLLQGIYFAQVPEIHLSIEAFFSGIKSLLDLLVQLLSTEKIVGVEVGGFHRTGDVYGGRVLNALESNAKVEKKNIAEVCSALIKTHKEIWIDNVIQTRDFLVHPIRFAHQLMFGINLAAEGDNLIFKDIIPPHIGEVFIYEYAEQQILNIDKFAKAFLSAIKIKTNTA